MEKSNWYSDPSIYKLCQSIAYRMIQEIPSPTSEKISEIFEFVQRAMVDYDKYRSARMEWLEAELVRSMDVNPFQPMKIGLDVERHD